MELAKFIENFSAQFEEIDVENINKSVKYKELNTWDSLTVMSVQVMIEDECKVKLTSQEINAPSTLEELFELVKKKIVDNE